MLSYSLLACGLRLGLLPAHGAARRQIQVGHLVHDVVGVSQQGVGEARLQQVHGEPGALLDDQVEEDVDGLAVAGLLLAALLGQSGNAVKYV